MTTQPHAPATPSLSLLLILVLGAIAALTPLAIDMYLPAMPEIARALQATPGQVQKTLVAYTGGFAIGQLIHGPISDSYGRRPVLIGGVLLFMVGAIFCALANDITTLTYVRIAQGFCGAAAAVVIQALVYDMFEREEFARTMSFITLVVTLAPLAAPMMGGYLSVWFGWRAIFWALVGFSALVIGLIFYLIPETLAPERRRPLHLGAILRNYMRMFANRASLGYILASGFSFAGMFAFLTVGSFVYIEHYGVSAENFGYFFGLNVVCLILFTSFNGKYVRKLGCETMLKIGLLVQLAAGVGLILGQVFDWGLWGTVVPVMFFVGTIAVVGSNATACMLTDYPELAGTASSLAGTMRFGIGALVGTLVSMIPIHTALPMTGAMAACAFVAAACYWGIVRPKQSAN